MLELLQSSEYAVACLDGAAGMLRLPDKSIKLVYGSPPYPNAERDYGVWKTHEYIEKISPFIDASVLKLRDDGFIVINVKANRENAM
jgi:DNA modification methylase